MFPCQLPLLQVAYTVQVSRRMLVNKAGTQLWREASPSRLIAHLMIARSHVRGVLYHYCFSSSDTSERAEGVAAHQGFGDSVGLRVHCSSRIRCIKAGRVPEGRLDRRFPESLEQLSGSITLRRESATVKMMCNSFPLWELHERAIRDG